MNYTNNTEWGEKLIPNAYCTTTYCTQASDLSLPVLSLLFSNRHNVELLNYLIFFSIRTLTDNGSFPNPCPHGEEQGKKEIRYRYCLRRRHNYHHHYFYYNLHPPRHYCYRYHYFCYYHPTKCTKLNEHSLQEQDIQNEIVLAGCEPSNSYSKRKKKFSSVWIYNFHCVSSHECSIIKGSIHRIHKWRPKGHSTIGRLYIEMLFTLLQTQNIGVLLFIVIYESFGVLKPRKKSFLVDKNSDMPTHCCVPLCTKIYLDKVTGAKISYFRFPTEENLSSGFTQ